MTLQVPASQIPRVSLHDGNGRRLGALTTAESINRSHSVDRQDRAVVTIALTDPLVGACDPLEGRILAVESSAYPVPWVGKITEWRGDRSRVELIARSYDGILKQRFLPAIYRTRLTAGEEMARILSTVNGRNPTGIALGAVENHVIVDGLEFPEWDAARALDAIADLAGMEWWLEHFVSPAAIDTRLRVARSRGTDRYRRVTLYATGEADGGNAEWTRWRGDAEAATFATTVIAGQESITQSFTERARHTVLRQQDAGFLDGFAGGQGSDGASADDPGRGSMAIEYAPSAGATGGSPVTRVERVVIEEQLKSRDVTVQAARAALQSRRYSEQVIDVNVISVGTWPDVQVGDVVRLVAPGAFVKGFDGPVRVLGVQPMEELGVMRTTLELLVDLEADPRDVVPAEPEPEPEPEEE
jgi:hypothetical protein